MSRRTSPLRPVAIVLSLALVLVVALAVAEAVARYRVAAHIKEGIRADTSPTLPVDVGFGTSPVIFSLPDRTLRSLKLDLGPFPEDTDLTDATISVDAHRVDYSSSDDIVAGDVTAHLSISREAFITGLTDAIMKQNLGVLESLLTVDHVDFAASDGQNSGRVTVHFSQGLGEATATPEVTPEGQLAYEITDLQVLGQDVGPLSQALSQAFPQATPGLLKALPAGLSAREVTVTDSAILVTLTGKDFHTSALEGELPTSQ